MMHPRLLGYFNEELLYMRESAAEFARLHPSVAAQLGIGATEVADPYVERLIEAFCLLSARTRIKLDAEFPRFAQRLLEVLHPHFLAPMPAAGVAGIRPDAALGALGGGLRIAAGTRMLAQLAEHPDTPVQWRSCHDVVLWPLRIADARLHRRVPDLPLPPPGAASRPPARASLQLRLQTLAPWQLEQLQGLDSLRIHLAGDVQMASRLFERLHAGFAGGVVAAPGRTREARALPDGALIYEGLQPGQGLLPLRYNTLHAHNLLQEYFHASQCLYEFTLRGLGAALAGLDGSVVDLWLLLDDAPAELAAWLNADALALFATPVLNLFEGRTDRLRLAPERSEYHLVVDRTRPLDFEVWAVDELRGQPAGADTEICFRPLYQTLHRDGADHSRYFSMRREQRVLSAAARRCGTRSPYVGTEVYLSLVDQFDAPFRADLDQLSVRAWLTNRDLAMGMARPAPECRALGLQAGVAGAAMLRAPSPPAPALGLQHSAWSLIRLLGMHHLPLAELDAQSAAQALRELLGLFAQPADAAAARRIDGLLGARMHATTRRLPQPGPLVYGRTLECDLQVDDEAFAPASPLLFGMVLERLLGEYASINTCTSLRLHSAQRGPLWCSPARMGSRGIV